MTSRMWLLLSWTVVGALMIVVHAAVLLTVLKADKPARRYRWLALIPPVAPIVAWIGGGRKSAITWLITATTYIVLRVLEGVI